MLLAIDTSTRFAGVALADGDRVVATRSWYSSVNHTAELMPAVVQLLKSHAVAVKDLEGVAVALGPGGFSALRVGISVGKGLAAAGGIPILGVGSLDVEAFPFSDCGLPVCVFLEAGRGEVASALFRPDGQRARDDRVTPPAEVLAEIGEPTVFCGEGIAALAGGNQSGSGVQGSGLPARSGRSDRFAGRHGPDSFGRRPIRRPGHPATLLPAYAQHRGLEAARP